MNNCLASELCRHWLRISGQKPEKMVEIQTFLLSVLPFVFLNLDGSPRFSLLLSLSSPVLS